MTTATAWVRRPLPGNWAFRKYLGMEEEVISAYLSNTDRQKKLDNYRDYIVHLLETFPLLSAVKIQRKLQNKYSELGLSSRTIRRYTQSTKSFNIDLVKLLPFSLAQKSRQLSQTGGQYVML